VVLGAAGRNFAAGMSGGVAYVFDEDGAFRDHCNLETVALEALSAEDLQDVKAMVQRHAAYTQSARAKQLLALWDDVSRQFVKVMPKDFRRMLEAIQQAEQDGLVGEDAVMMAFEANKNDVARVSGN